MLINISHISILALVFLLLVVSTAKGPTDCKDYWEEFPDSGITRVVISMDATETLPTHLPTLFLNNINSVKDVEINDKELAENLARSITGANGVAGAKLVKQTRNFARKLGTISFYRDEEKFDVTIANCGFFMGPEMNDFHLFYSWTLAKLIHDIALKEGNGLSQEGFNSLSGARSIAVHQFFAIAGADDHERFRIYNQRPAKVWDIFPSLEDWTSHPR